MRLSQQLELAIVECLVQRVSEGDSDGGWPVELQTSLWQRDGDIWSLQEGEREGVSEGGRE